MTEETKQIRHSLYSENLDLDEDILRPMMRRHKGGKAEETSLKQTVAQLDPEEVTGTGCSQATP
jgi:hypothetical protein